ncbi:molybdenum cofactor guanylyltransferase [Metaclostridioides mangenotii]
MFNNTHILICKRRGVKIQPIQKTGVILAGGKSKRMGKNKAFLKFKNSNFIDIAIEAFKNFDEVIVISNEKNLFSNYNVKVYEDEIKELGPIGGIYTALNVSKYDIVVVACDMPFVNSFVVEKIAKQMYDISIVSVYDEKIQPLCSGYKKEILKEVKLCISKNNLKLKNLVDRIDKKHVYFNLSENYFKNINTIEEFENIDRI